MPLLPQSQLPAWAPPHETVGTLGTEPHVEVKVFVFISLVGMFKCN